MTWRALGGQFGLRQVFAEELGMMVGIDGWQFGGRVVGRSGSFGGW